MVGERLSARGPFFMQRRETRVPLKKGGYDCSSDTEDSQSCNASSSGEGSSLQEVDFIKTTAKFELFDHQVSGHMPLISSGGGRIGKPAVPEEVAFYEEVLDSYPQLCPFVPGYVGCLELSFSEIEALGSEIRFARDEDDMSCCEERPGQTSDSYWSVDQLSRASNWTRRRKRNPELRCCPKAKMWSNFIKRYCRELSMKWEDERKRSVRFILLEDLTFPFRNGKASILDIKLGTRQYRIGASPEKEHSQYLKSRTTTTGQFGLRLNGMRIWNSATKSFIVHDKYWGRSLQSDTLGPAIREFFHDGRAVRKEVIPSLIVLIEELSEAIRAAEATCRFYSSSILLIYDGISGNVTRPHVDVRMIDFANSISNTTGTALSGPVDLSNHPEDGCLFGLSNLIKLLDDVLKSD